MNEGVLAVFRTIPKWSGSYVFFKNETKRYLKGFRPDFPGVGMEAKIKRIHGFNLTPLSQVEKGTPGETVVFSHKLENLGNDTEQVELKLIAAPPGAKVRFMAGNDEVRGRLMVPEGATLNLWVLFQMPKTTPYGDKYAVKVLATLPGKDGGHYVGFDGQDYGGKDEVTITDYIQL